MVYSISDPLPPPGDITLSEIRLALVPELRFNWTKNVVKNCQISYHITSDCGSCPTSTPINTAICIDVPIDNHTCSFAVRTVVCGSIDGTHSNSILVTLKGIANIFFSCTLGWQWSHYDHSSWPSEYWCCSFVFSWSRTASRHQNNFHGACKSIHVATLYVFKRPILQPDPCTTSYLYMGQNYSLIL